MTNQDQSGRRFLPGRLVIIVVVVVIIFWNLSNGNRIRKTEFLLTTFV